MKKQKTVYQLIVDKSGSMQDCKEKTILGFNEQVKKLSILEKEFPEQHITMGLTTFNDQVTQQFFQASPNNVQKLTENNYRPNGGTALLDAIGSTVQFLENYRLTQSTFDTTSVIVILTDGYENSSRMYNLDHIRTLITRLEATGKWTFSFIGATLDAVDVATSMNIKRQNSRSFSKECMDNEVWEDVSNKLYGYLNKKRSGKDLDNFLEK